MEGVTDSGGLDLLDLWHSLDPDGFLALAVDPDTVSAERDDPGADPVEHVLARPPGLLGDQRGLVLIGEQDVRAVDELADQRSLAKGELLGRVGDAPIATLAAPVGVAQHGLRVRAEKRREGKGGVSTGR